MYDGLAWATLRERAHSIAMPCSAAATVLAVGAFTTRQPYCMSQSGLLMSGTASMSASRRR